MEPRILLCGNLVFEIWMDTLDDGLPRLLNVSVFLGMFDVLNDALFVRDGIAPACGEQLLGVLSVPFSLGEEECEEDDCKSL